MNEDGDRWVLARKRIPSYPPIYQTIAILLLVDRLHVPGWAWGMTGTLLAFLWISFFVLVFREKERDFETVSLRITNDAQVHGLLRKRG